MRDSQLGKGLNKVYFTPPGKKLLAGK